MERKRKAIVTLPPHAPFIDEVLSHDIVSGIRLNTVMPIKGSLEDKLKELDDKAKGKDKELWIDLKCRQLRVKSFGVPPFTEIELSHEIEVYTPTKAYFSDRSEHATILEVNGSKLIMQEGPRRVVGPGESVTIPHPTLKITGYLTDTDKKYIEAANKIGIHTYMISFVEGNNDIAELIKHDSDAEIIEKIESINGLRYVHKEWQNNGRARLMAARGDLYMELQWPHKIAEAVEDILGKDQNAIVASRILSSLADSPEPSCSDVGDVDNLLRMGYKTFMFGDEVCLKRDTVISALNVFEHMARRYEK